MPATNMQGIAHLIALTIVLWAGQSHAQSDASSSGSPALEASNAPVVEMAHFCAQPSARQCYYSQHALEHHIGARGLGLRARCQRQAEPMSNR